MPNVRYRRAVTYIVLGATAAIGSFAGTRARAATVAPDIQHEALQDSAAPTPTDAASAPASPVVIAPAPAVAPVPTLPLPEALVPQVKFWKRVYTEIDTNHGYIHDAWHLDVIYKTVPTPRGSRRHNAAVLQQDIAPIITALRDLANGHRENLSPLEAQVLAAWPTDVSNATLLEAAQNVRFQCGQSDKFRAGVVRSRTWMPFIEKTLTAAGLPRELAALPHVESSFNMNAYSKVKAAGIWQFMPATAHSFMHMDSTVDERYDPIRSTESAARLLAQNYRLLGSWPLAVTAYNHGPEGMRRAAAATGSKDLVTIIAHYKTHHFGFASRNFYAELMAAWDVSQHAEDYFGKLPLQDAPQYETVTMDAFYHVGSVSAALGVDKEVLHAHNPALRPVVWNNSRLIPRGFTMRIPKAYVHGNMVALLGTIRSGERYAHADVAPSKSTRQTIAHARQVAMVGIRHVQHHARHFVARHRSRNWRVARKAGRPTLAQAHTNTVLPWEAQQAGHAMSRLATRGTGKAWLE